MPLFRIKMVCLFYNKFGKVNIFLSAGCIQGVSGCQGHRGAHCAWPASLYHPHSNTGTDQFTQRVFNDLQRTRLSPPLPPSPVRKLSLSSQSSTLPVSRRFRVMNQLEGSLSQFSTFVYRGSSHRPKGAACPRFDMVWQYLSPISGGTRG